VSWLLPVGVASTELSPVLLVIAAILGLSAVRTFDPPRLLGAVICLATVILCVLPLVEIRATQQEFDAATDGLVGLPPSSVQSVSITRGIVFAEPGGRPLSLDIYRPLSEHLFPVVIQIYGGAWSSGKPGDDSAFATALAKDGFLVVSIDYRHAPDARWPAQIDDVRAGIDWVIAHAGEYGGDSQHVGLVGRSSGAQLALVAAYTDSERIEAVVSFYGPTNLTQGWKEPPSPDPLQVRPVLEELFGGTPGALPKLYEAASPVTYVSRGLPPTLLIYGARDHVVESRFGKQLHDRLKAAGNSSIFLELPWAEHAFDEVPGLGARVTMPYVERFFVHHLH
jgi:acetyl esterase/lipase